jgi:transposase InsO family protein
LEQAAADFGVYLVALSKWLIFREKVALPGDRQPRRHRGGGRPMLSPPGSRPTELLQSQTTRRTPTQSRREWLAGLIREVHIASRGTYGYRRNHAELTMAMGVKVCPAPGGIVHADHGSQFTSWAFEEKIRSAGLLPSFGTVGDGLDNAMIVQQPQAS